MKKLTMFVVALFAITASTFAQEKGQIQFGLDGALFMSGKSRMSGAKSSSVIIPMVSGRYFVADKIGIDGGLTIEKWNKDAVTNGDAATDKIGIDLVVGGRYYYWSQDKMRLNGGVDLMLGFGKGRERFDDKLKKVSMPIDVLITPAEFEYWPMDGGAITSSLFYQYGGMNQGDAGVSAFGVDLGIKIRLQ